MTEHNRRPLVSIVTPSLNQGRFIRDTVESVLSQDYPRIEYLVMDGGSTDNTLEVLRGYGDRLTWRSAPDSGQADAVNAGFRLTRGTILGWLNSDDTYRPGAVTAAVEHFTAHPDAAAVYGNAYYIDHHKTIIGAYPTEDFSMSRLAETCMIGQPASFIRRDALEAVGMLDPTLRYCMDYDLWIRLARGHRIDRIDQFLASMRRHPHTKSFSETDQMFREIAAVVKRSFGRVPPHWPSWHGYHRLTKRYRLIARWVVWPARRILPTPVEHWLRKKVPLLLGRATSRQMSKGGRP